MTSQEFQQRITARQSFLLANDGQFLGKLSLNQYDPESISNEYGAGNPYSATSTKNEYSIYGSPYSALSPYNPYTTTPPKIFLRGNFYGFLTKNMYMQNAVDPDNLIYWMRQQRLDY